jgi:type IV secretory pathway VirB10-like protein
MNTRALAWFEDDDPQDLLRWAVAAAVVVLIYAAAIGGYLYWHQQLDEDLGDETTAIAIELTVPEIEQQEQAKVDQPPPPQDTTTDVTLPEEKPPEKIARIVVLEPGEHLRGHFASRVSSATSAILR